MSVTTALRKQKYCYKVEASMLYMVSSIPARYSKILAQNKSSREMVQWIKCLQYKSQVLKFGSSDPKPAILVLIKQRYIVNWLSTHARIGKLQVQ